tara:strand:+ start:61 stop:288 length:228 start_codon:yes stop_codon:yes gene_type:complete
MKIKALKNTSASGQSLEVGKIYDVSDKDAEILIRMKKAEASTESIAECSVPEASLPPAPPTGSKTKKVKSSVNTN